MTAPPGRRSSRLNAAVTRTSLSLHRQQDSRTPRSLPLRAAARRYKLRNSRNRGDRRTPQRPPVNRRARTATSPPSRPETPTFHPASCGHRRQCLLPRCVSSGSKDRELGDSTRSPTSSPHAAGHETISSLSSWDWSPKASYFRSTAATSRSMDTDIPGKAPRRPPSPDSNSVDV